MGDKVHPYGAPIHYPCPFEGQHANPQQEANPQTPAEMHEQHKQRLLGTTQIAVNQVPFNQQEDPAREHAGLPLQLVRRRRRRCMWRCCCCVGAIVGTFVVFLGILVLLFFLVLHPKLPKYTITQAKMTKFSMSNSTTAAEAEAAGALFLNAEVQLMVKMSNPNKKIGIDYRSIRAALFYEGLEIGEGSIPRFYQGHRNISYVELPMVGHNITLTPSLGATLQARLTNDDSLTFHARTIVHVRIKIGSWTSHTSKVRVKCHLQISNPTRGNVQLLDDGCKFKLLRLRL
ncbi:hypothetical protein GOP47_0011869 [Adiantum capillus-veneris]|uniref:Late embryogenesis abundant protein LEA-2 subgroup domain-containing protein n=1 Tax=Adiantum capillus-veneris TaxID=13818 RepID=A0A9D4ZI77_ADICA|nr:hypothetical protein GOP47_0011869 [Adiantum capillus-veneris]